MNTHPTAEESSSVNVSTQENNYPPLSKSSKFNLKFMWNVNKLSIAVFVIAILIKLISKLF